MNDIYVNNQQKYPNVFSMFRYISLIILKKTSTWLITILFLIILLLVLLIPLFGKFFNNVISFQAIPMTSILSSIIVTLSAGIQGVLRGINIFKDSQKDGIEIILIAKPMTRKTIIIARFLFLFSYSFILALLQMIIIVIALGVVGYDAYIKLHVLGWMIAGGFGASFLAFLCMAMVAAMFSIFLSGRSATLIPIFVLILSSIINSTFTQIAGFVISSPTRVLSNNLCNNVIEKFNTSLKENPELYKSANQNYLTGIKLERSSQSILTIVYDKNYTPYLVINENASFSYSINNVWVPYSNFYLLDSNNSDMNNRIDGDQQLWSKVNKELVSNIVNLLPSLSAHASGAVAINYLNPITAFSVLAGSTSLYINSFDVSSVPYNWSITHINDAKSLTINNITYNNSFTYTSVQADPPWAIAILWIFIFISLASILSISYKRKDFQ